MVGNLFSAVPFEIGEEILETLVQHGDVRIERILSKGHTSPETGWYDQQEHEWVVVLKGAGTLTFEDGEVVEMGVGDYINIPAHRRHRVSWTAPDEVTLWLALFYR